MLYNSSPATIHTLLYCFYHLAGAGVACMQGRWVLLLEAPRHLTCTPTHLPAYCYTQVSQTEAAAFFSHFSRAKLLCFSLYYTKQHMKLCPVCKNYALLTTLSTQRQRYFSELLKLAWCLLLTAQQSRLHVICNGHPASDLQPIDLFTLCSTE